MNVLGYTYGKGAVFQGIVFGPGAILEFNRAITGRLAKTIEITSRCRERLSLLNGSVALITISNRPCFICRHIHRTGKQRHIELCISGNTYFSGESGNGAGLHIQGEVTVIIHVNVTARCHRSGAEVTEGYPVGERNGCRSRSFGTNDLTGSIGDVPSVKAGLVVGNAHGEGKDSFGNSQLFTGALIDKCEIVRNGVTTAQGDAAGELCV